MKKEDKIALYTDPRILQANERTLLAWIRTGIALVTFGFVITKFGFLEYLISPQYRAHLSPFIGIGPYLGGALSFFSVVIQAFAIVRYRNIFARFHEGENVIGTAIPTFLGVMIVLFGIFISIYLIS